MKYFLLFALAEHIGITFATEASAMAVMYGRGGISLWLPQSVRLSADGAGSHLTFWVWRPAFLLNK